MDGCHGGMLVSVALVIGILGSEAPVAGSALQPVSLELHFLGASKPQRLFIFISARAVPRLRRLAVVIPSPAAPPVIPVVTTWILQKPVSTH